MAANCPDPLRGREYLRVSKDPTGRMRSPKQQHEANVKSAAANGIVLGEAYAETKAVGASRYSDGVRVGFAVLLADLEAGRFGADVLVLWENSRGSREVDEWVKLLKLLETRGHRVWITSEERLYDPRNPHDRRALLSAAVESEYEVAKISLRIRRDVASNAAAGRPHGRPNFGLRSVYDEGTGALLGWAHDTTTCGTSVWSRAEVVAELFGRIERGHSFRLISRDFEAAGVVNKSGDPFSPEHLRHLATRPAYTGLRHHHGELIEATWEPVVSRAQWHRVQRLLSGPKHQTSTTRPGRAVHTFSQIIRCHECGGPMSVQEQRPGRLEYRCQEKGCTRIGKADVDERLDYVIVDYLSRPDAYEQWSAGPVPTEQLEELEERIAQNQRELDEAEDAEPANLAEGRMFAKVVDNLKRQIDEDRATLRALTMPSELAQLIEPGEDVAGRWKAAPVATRRRVAEILLSPGFLGQVRIRRSPNPRRGAPLDQRMVWRRVRPDA